ncbi:MAG TPA: ribose-phosphate pyrophosphokinase [Candidatus Krumholzibacteria bacterium]|nr:ribose-phosphate pyrophosphokinase [Candidatus Krumholzibacteria bacterium]
MDGLKLISGNANRPLAEKVGEQLGVPLCDVTLDRFADGEIQCKINENIRGVDVFIVQSTQPPAENLMELLILLDACFLASAERITVVTPYYGYARQDRKDQPRVPITAKLIAKLLEVAGTNRILTLDLHSTQIQGFFDIQADNLFAAPVILEYIKQLDTSNLMIVSPDVGSTKIGRAFAKRLDVDLAIVDKRRSEKDNVEVMNVIGDVKGRDVVILDDMITTGGTLVKAARAVSDKGARSVLACATHPVFAGDACKIIMNSPIREVVVTNSLPFDRFAECPKVKVLDISRLIAEAIKRIHYNESVSTLFV